MDTIEAKPTQYGLRTFKSRLEARWAVFLDHQPLAWVYEPKTFKDPETGWGYTPDFAVVFKRTDCRPPFHVFIEIKPLIPTDEHLHVLSKFASIMTVDLWLCWGSFFKTVPNVCNLSQSLSKTFDGKDVSKASVPLNKLKNVFTRPDQAIVTAAMYRFDLPPKKTKRKKGRR